MGHIYIHFLARPASFHSSRDLRDLNLGICEIFPNNNNPQSATSNPQPATRNPQPTTPNPQRPTPVPRKTAKPIYHHCEPHLQLTYTHAQPKGLIALTKILKSPQYIPYIVYIHHKQRTLIHENIATINTGVPLAKSNLILLSANFYCFQSSGDLRYPKLTHHSPKFTHTSDHTQ